MRRRMFLVFASLCACFGLANSAWSEKRVAPVVGNGAYETVANLPNPPRDATAIANLLKAAGFDEVTIKTDLTLSKIRAELRDFTRRALDADEKEPDRRAEREYSYRYKWVEAPTAKVSRWLCAARGFPQPDEMPAMSPRRPVR